MKSSSWIRRIAFGQTCLLVSVLLTAYAMDILPDPKRSDLDARAQLCEAIAVNASVYVTRRDNRSLKSALETTVERNASILSAAVRRGDGAMLSATEHHAVNWRSSGGNYSTETHVVVPIYSNGRRWGAVELSFEPQSRTGLAGLLANRWLVPGIFIAGCTLILNIFYLKRVIGEIDSDRVKSGQLVEVLDRLGSGIFVVDCNESILHANKSFASMVGTTRQQLVGLEASELPWSRIDARPQDYVWQQTLAGDFMPGSEILVLEMNDQPPRRVLIESCPVLGGDKDRCRGAIVRVTDVTDIAKEAPPASTSELAAVPS